jgi:hypothetical protein
MAKYSLSKIRKKNLCAFLAIHYIYEWIIFYFDRKYNDWTLKNLENKKRRIYIREPDPCQKKVITATE